MQATEIVNVSQSATGSSSQPPTRSTSDAGAGGREKPETPLVKPQRFDGCGSLGTFLLQFEQLSEYMQWGERARHYNLGASLEGPACHVLMELPATGSTSADVIKLLQSKFGMNLQAESFQAKLKAHHRKEGDTIQDLYKDISRLLQLAYPGEDIKSITRYGIDAFITALSDGPMEFEVMKLRPSSLQEAADCTTRLKAYAETVSNRSTVAVERGNGKSKVPGRSCAIFRTTVESGNSDTKEATLLECLGQLDKQLEQVVKGNQDARCSSSEKAGSKKDGSSRGQSASKNGEKVHPNPETHP